MNCLYVGCPSVEDIASGSVTVSGTLPGSIAVYCCESGFELVGVSVRYCRNNSTWSGDAPVCTREFS